MCKPVDATDPLHPTVRAYVRSSDIAATYDTDFADNELFRYDCCFLDEYLAPPGAILDLGCGTGRHLTFLACRGFRVFGLDLSPHMLQEARHNLAATAQEARLVQADFHRLPLAPSARFHGMLFMFSTLGLVSTQARRRAVLASLRPHLRSRGRMLAHVHNDRFRDHRGCLERMRHSVRQWMDEAERGDKVMPRYRGIQDLYLHSFTQDEVVELFETSGYRLLEVRPLNSRRNGPYEGPDAQRNANGFLVAAGPR